MAALLKTLNQDYKYLGLNKEDANDLVDLEMRTALTYLDSAVTMLASGYLNEGILLAAREILASLGKKLSACVLASILQTRELEVELVNLAGTVDSHPLFIIERIKDAFKAIDLSKCLVVATLF